MVRGRWLARMAGKEKGCEMSKGDEEDQFL